MFSWVNMRHLSLKSECIFLHQWICASTLNFSLTLHLVKNCYDTLWRISTDGLDYPWINISFVDKLHDGAGNKQGLPMGAIIHRWALHPLNPFIQGSHASYLAAVITIADACIRWFYGRLRLGARSATGWLLILKRIQPPRRGGKIMYPKGQGGKKQKKRRDGFFCFRTQSYR